MKKFFAITFILTSLFLSTQHAEAQAKFGYVSSQELITAMPDFKKADTSLKEFEVALNGQYEEMVQDFRVRDSLLRSKDTLKYTKAQLELKRRELGSPVTETAATALAVPSAWPGSRRTARAYAARD